MLAVGFGMAFYALAGNTEAAVTGICSNCHTMHNSQGGTFMGRDATPDGNLLTGGCVGCHTGTNFGGTDVVPYVYQTTEPDYGADGTTGDTLAGGNFYWVADGGGDIDNKGHNVVGLSGVDTIGKEPPGWDADWYANGQVGTWGTAQLTCDGANGCHGEHTTAGVSGAHHATDTTIDGSTVGKSFRMLKGILGKEDPDWEWVPTATEHNQYKGAIRTSDTTNPTETISYSCAECHGKFHGGAGTDGVADATFASVWIRHPTDFDMNNVSGEYGYYNVDNSYSVVAPVASADVSAVKDTVLEGAGDAIVTCISCHRAHGTKWDDLLRWEYTMNAGGGASTAGCFICHTTKDTG